ncbi:hypothetical protein B0T16DRAFT_428842 [Cercophora newfieldiana]|uniref:Homeobox domain-containing protein n=1 Tax=Cercophora newfieldiana TaxID=92897 RepID=A0AA40CQU5_9PEZI|nr:hypothetical protein B0T16DRAFT_428842 [Cercophora newfieldiana]
MLHWKCDDLFVLPELEDLEKCLREDYRFETETFAIPSENAHLELMLKLGDMVKKHESEDTLFVVYYGGHARIDESRQSTWCATRNPGSPWLQWSAIQTLLERSVSDVLILLDCCAGAASATFPTGKSITETISASSWDAIAPDPGRYSFTNALIEVLQEWRLRIFSAAMLHAEVLARLKHPRPILINGKHFEARSTPVHFMMTSNHRAPSIEIGRVVPESRLPPSPPKEIPYRQLPAPSQLPLMPDEAISQDLLVPSSTEPNEDQPHVMISLALEEDQKLDINAWEQWLGSFPALAKYVKVQGVFKSHSTLLLLSLPVMVWDLLPDDPACSFIAFIRSNNLIKGPETGSVPTTTAAATVQVEEQEQTRPDTESWMTGTTFSPTDDSNSISHGFPPTRPRLTRNQSLKSETESWGLHHPIVAASLPANYGHAGPFAPTGTLFSPVSHTSSTSLASFHGSTLLAASPTSTHRPHNTHRPIPGGGEGITPLSDTISRTTILNQSKSSIRTNFAPEHDVPEGPQLAQHVVRRLEKYFQKDPEPNMALTEVIASNLGVEVSDINLWFHHRREQERLTHNLQSLRLGENSPTPESHNSSGVQMILPGHLNTLLEIYPSKSVLIVDLRSTTDFEKSHIHDAVNLRAPLMYVENTSLEMIEDTFMDDQSRRNFSKWRQCRCVVFYDRVVEFEWECPAAGALYDKFRRKGWSGQGFVLKGHYKEISASFDRYISGSKMSKDAKGYLDGLRGQSSLTPEEAERRNRRYEDWLRTVTTEDRVPQRVELIPARKLERRRAVENYQKELEAEFEVRFPALYRKALALGKRRSDSPPPPSAREPSPPPPWSDRPFGEQDWVTQGDDGTGGGRYGGPADDASFSDRKAAFVEPLMSGLEKIRGAAAASGYADGGHGYRDAVMAKETGYAAGGSYMAPPADKLDQFPEGYEDVDPNSEGLRNDPLFQKAGTGKYQESSGGDDGGGKKSGRMANVRKAPIWGRLRSGK